MRDSAICSTCLLDDNRPWRRNRAATGTDDKTAAGFENTSTFRPAIVKVCLRAMSEIEVCEYLSCDTNVNNKSINSSGHPSHCNIKLWKRPL